MVRINKRMKQGLESLDRTKVYSLKDAIAQLASFPKVKFDETVELHFHLGIDIKKNEESVRGTVALPHGTGRKIRVIAFCKGENSNKAKNAGADLVGAEDLIEKIEKGFLDFDCVVATPDMMRDVSRLGRVLGPRGLMPSPKAGTVAMDIEKAIKDVKAGRIEFKSDKQGGVHVGIGKRSFSSEKLFDNAACVMEALGHAKPAVLKGQFIKSVFLSSTMGPGLKVQL